MHKINKLGAPQITDNGKYEKAIRVSNAFHLIGVLAAVPTAVSAKEHPIKEKVFILLYGTGSNQGTEDYDRWDYDGLRWYNIPTTGIIYYVNIMLTRVVHQLELLRQLLRHGTLR